MAQSFKTDVEVKGNLRAQNTSVGLNTETLTADKQLTALSPGWHTVQGASTYDVVLPDPATISSGQAFTVMVDGISASSQNVMSYDAVTPVLLKTVLPGRAYAFTHLGANVWQINYLEEADLLVAERYVGAFNATTDWTAGANNYTYTLAQATHLRGVNPTVELYEGTGPYSETDALISIAANGDVTVTVNGGEVDARFAGQLVLV
jgi:hypothetical protein